MQDAVGTAQITAPESNHTLLEPSHLLLTMLDGNIELEALLTHAGDNVVRIKRN
ncbi:hypothetical protein NQX30_00240 [Candidatus Persebacteraceae bacterium Df01]|jgi:hypothetical protein|uniref:Clp R domain-containing protein n=1 Tax=Candidatus Doriopsillibacter californiensis TaxID=2970740 RepID=A0ABT7QK62_9GAMM|nr:hypothetical protein [Candidatus Persebacteraceae bacterium Df01]